MKKITHITYTTLVLEALKRADDFRTAKQLCVETGANPNQVSAALYSLRHYRAVDCVEGEATLWWFATPDSDTRSRTTEERAHEFRPRNRKPGYKIKKQP